jgi:uncharacterized protein YdeI (YjbR/CyaY-like superfamily)
MAKAEDSVHHRMASGEELSIVELSDQLAWRKWLEANHASADFVWLKFAKKTSPRATVTYPEAVEEALCFGWIDGQVRRHDEHFYLQRFTPRRARSKWSQINCEKAERLIAAGRMHSSGVAQVEAAKADGRWQAAYPAPSRATVPEDLERALEDNAAAKQFFESLSGSARYAFLYRLHDVTDGRRRAKRIADYVARLAAGKTL